MVSVAGLLIALPSTAAVRYLGQFGSHGSGPGQFNVPCCVAVDPTSGDVYVTDVQGNRVEKFDSSGRYLLQFQVSSPFGVAVDPSTQDLYVTNYVQVSKYDPSGKFLEMWGWGVSDGADSFEICTSSCHGGRKGSGQGEFELPQRVAVDRSNGNVLVTDSMIGRVQEFDSSGNFLSQFGVGHVKDPFGIAVASNGTVYVGNMGYVSRFSRAGGYLSRFGVAGGDSNGQFAGLAINPLNEDVYATDHQANRVVEFSPTGKFLETWGWGVADGHRRFEACTRTCRVGLSGSGKGEFRNKMGGGLDGIATDAAGNIYAADAGNDRIQKFANPVPRNIGRPVISGTPAAHKILSCSHGLWANGTIGFRYSWQQNAQAIAGANRSSYRVQVQDEGQTLTCSVIATNFGGPSKPSTSKGVRPPRPKRTTKK